MKEVRISPTMLSYWTEENACPEKVRHTYIDREVPFEPSDAMILGSWMEFMMIGRSTDGEVEPSGLTDKMKKSAAGKRIVLQAQKWKSIVEHYKITDIEVQVAKKIPVNLKYGGYETSILMSGIYDIKCKVDGVPSIIDIKYAANARNTFGDFAWGNPQGMDLKQSMHYPMMELHDTGEVVDFYYFVFDSTPQMNFVPMKIRVSDGSIEQYMIRVQTAWTDILNERLLSGKAEDAGYQRRFRTNPSIWQCSSCPYTKEDCMFKVEFPPIKEIDY